MADSSKYKFIDGLPEDLKCVICDQAANVPQQHGSCGRIFCKDCLENYRKERPYSRCLFCLQNNPVFFLDRRGKVLSRHMYIAG